jgi:sec-independent protein translocase protein TatB
MFGIGFTEILLIAIVAVLFLGPDKLPEAMVQIAKFFKSVKKTVNEAKSSFEEEIRIADLKEEALSYKQKLDSANRELQGFKNIGMDEILGDTIEEEDKPAVQSPPKKETVTFNRSSQTAKTDNTDKNGEDA